MNLHPWRFSRPGRIKALSSLVSWSDHIADPVLSRTAEVQPKLFYDALTSMEAGTDCGSLYFVDPVREHFLTSLSSQTENYEQLLLDVCTRAEHHMHSSNLLNQYVTWSDF